MDLYKAGCFLALCAGAGALTAAPLATGAQDHRQQEQQRQRDGGNGGQQQANRGQDQRQRPQQDHGQGDRGRGPRQDHGQQARGRGPRQGRGPQGRPGYQFRSQDVSRLRQYYGGRLGRIDRHHRAYFAPGGYIPGYYRGYLRPVPPDMLGYLPPPPPGYAIGYYNGYCVVYNPATYLIASVLNLLQ